MPIKFVPIQGFVPDAAPVGETSVVTEATNFLPAFGNYRILRKKSSLATQTLTGPPLGAFSHTFTATHSLQQANFVVARSNFNALYNLDDDLSYMIASRGKWWKQFSWGPGSTPYSDRDVVYPTSIIKTTSAGGNWTVTGPKKLLANRDPFDPVQEGLLFEGNGQATLKTRFGAWRLPPDILEGDDSGPTPSTEEWGHHHGGAVTININAEIAVAGGAGTIDDIKVWVDGDLRSYEILAIPLSVGTTSTTITSWVSGRPKRRLDVQVRFTGTDNLDDIWVQAVNYYPREAENAWVQETIGAGTGQGSYMGISDLTDYYNNGAGTLNADGYGSTLIQVGNLQAPVAANATLTYYYRVKNTKDDGKPWAIETHLYEHDDPENMPEKLDTILPDGALKIAAPNMTSHWSSLLTGSDDVDEWTRETQSFPVAPGPGATINGNAVGDDNEVWKRLFLQFRPSADPNEPDDAFVDEDREEVLNNGFRTKAGKTKSLQESVKKGNKRGEGTTPAAPSDYIISRAADEGDAEIIFKVENMEHLLSLFGSGRLHDINGLQHEKQGPRLKIWGQFPQDGLTVTTTIYQDWEAQSEDPDADPDENSTRVLQQFTTAIAVGSTTWQMLGGASGFEWICPRESQILDNFNPVDDWSSIYVGIKVEASSTGTEWVSLEPVNDGLGPSGHITKDPVGAATWTELIDTKDAKFIGFIGTGIDKAIYPRNAGNPNISLPFTTPGETWQSFNVGQVDKIPKKGTEVRFAWKAKRNDTRMTPTLRIWKNDESTELAWSSMRSSAADWQNATGVAVEGYTTIREDIFADLVDGDTLYITLEGWKGILGGASVLEVDYLALEYGTPAEVKIANIFIEQPSTTRIEIADVSLTLPHPIIRKEPDASTVFVGTSDKLYRIEGSSWIDESIPGGYGVAEDPPGWDFCQWGTAVVATNGVDPVQAFGVNLPSATFYDFIDDNAGGTGPGSGFQPVGKYIAVVRPSILVLANITDWTNTPVGLDDYIAPDVVLWSGLDGGNTSVTPPSTEPKANFTPLGSGAADPLDEEANGVAGGQKLVEYPGEITGLVGGQTGLIFKRCGIWQMVYTGSELVFDFSVLSNNIGTPCHHSIVEVGNEVYFWTGSSFAAVQNRTNVIELGSGIVDEMLSDVEFEGEAILAPDSRNPSGRELHVVGAYDAHSGIIFWAYSGRGDRDVVKQRIVCYNTKTQAWGFLKDSRFATTYLFETHEIDSRKKHLTKGLLGVDYDDSKQSSVFSFSGDGTYPGNMKTSIIPILDGSSAQINRVRPLYHVKNPIKSYKPTRPQQPAVGGPAGPLRIEVTGRAGQEPTLTVGPQVSPQLGYDASGWSLLRMTGKWFDFEFEYPETFDAPVTTDYGILGYHIEWEEEDGTGDGR
jgi:hypothetical protein